jgi:hypothetical protein
MLRLKKKNSIRKYKDRIAELERRIARLESENRRLREFNEKRGPDTPTAAIFPAKVLESSKIRPLNPRIISAVRSLNKTRLAERRFLFLEEAAPDSQKRRFAQEE